MDLKGEELSIADNAQNLQNTACELLELLDIVGLANDQALQILQNYRNKLASGEQSANYSIIFEQLKDAFIASAKDVALTLNLADSQDAASQIVAKAREWFADYELLFAQINAATTPASSSFRNVQFLEQQCLDVSAVQAAGSLLHVINALDDMQYIAKVFKNDKAYAYLLDELAIYFKSFADATNLTETGHIPSKVQIDSLNGVSKFVTDDLKVISTRYKNKLSEENPNNQRLA